MLAGTGAAPDGARGGVGGDPTPAAGAGLVGGRVPVRHLSLDAEPRYLGHVRYGVISLGDSSYGETFCQGGLKFDARLQDLGAQRVGDVLCHDASGDTVAEDDAVVWCQAWLAQALASQPA